MPDTRGADSPRHEYVQQRVQQGAATLAMSGPLGLDCIIAVAMPDNVGSWRVMEKLGMRRERIAPFRGEESVWYALGRDEYASRPPKEAHGC